MSAPQASHPDDLRLPEGPTGRFDPVGALQVLAGELREAIDELTEAGYLDPGRLALRRYRIADALRMASPGPLVGEEEA